MPKEAGFSPTSDIDKLRKHILEVFLSLCIGWTSMTILCKFQIEIPMLVH